MLFLHLRGALYSFPHFRGEGLAKVRKLFLNPPLIGFYQKLCILCLPTESSWSSTKTLILYWASYKVVVCTLGVILCWESCLSVTGGKPAGWCRCGGRAITSSRGRVGASLSSDPRWCEAITRWGYAAAGLLILFEELMDGERCSSLLCLSFLCFINWFFHVKPQRYFIYVSHIYFCTIFTMID